MARVSVKTNPFLSSKDKISEYEIPSFPLLFLSETSGNLFSVWGQGEISSYHDSDSTVKASTLIRSSHVI